ncbi:hypothetical protein [Carboxydothermus pertinax]|uniref:Uncharacterized protein n=1 Tax=Carboxydothermus pertinax TaxID=870242 RepID=A0A1L8CVY6_9THEO|nr:hypothetical protein [Carboxydothermus pertinax]GAV23072.1 hypothetical protein cpu_15820 [Carboxydothermus pertinax]
MNFNNSGDIRDILFSKIMQKHYTAQIQAENGGIIETPEKSIIKNRKCRIK